MKKYQFLFCFLVFSFCCLIAIVLIFFITKGIVKEEYKEHRTKIEEQLKQTKPIEVTTNPYEYGYISVITETGEKKEYFGKIKIVNDGRNGKTVKIEQDTRELPNS